MNDYLSQNNTADAFSYSYVSTQAKVAVYTDLKAAPRILDIEPADTPIFIENLTVVIYEQAQRCGGSIPYTVIREVAENFIHAQFTEIVVSILPGGNTIRFTDQGPGIQQKDRAQLPGFTSATEPMKRFIRGVGSGLPIVKEYLNISQGSLTIEDNLTTGAVVTVSLRPQTPQNKQSLEQQEGSQILTPPLTTREKNFISCFLNKGALGVTDFVQLTGTPQSTTHNTLIKLEQMGVIEKTVNKKRILTEFGFRVANSL